METVFNLELYPGAEGVLWMGTQESTLKLHTSLTGSMKMLVSWIRVSQEESEKGHTMGRPTKVINCDNFLGRLT